MYSVSVHSVHQVSEYFYVRSRSASYCTEYDYRGVTHAFLYLFNFGAGTKIDSPATISPMEHSIHYL